MISPPDKSFQDIPFYILHPQVPFKKHLNNSCLKPWSPPCFRLNIAISSQLHVPRHVAPRFCWCPGVRTPVTPGFLGECGHRAPEMGGTKTSYCEMEDDGGLLVFLIFLWLVVWNIFLFFHILGIVIRFDEYFSEGLKPPTSSCMMLMWLMFEQRTIISKYNIGHLNDQV
jgi:hypothetical protein